MLVSFNPKVALSAAFIAAFAGPAIAGPDLIFDREEGGGIVTVTKEPSCAKDDPLIELRVTVKNRGDESARLPLLSTQVFKGIVGGAATGSPYTWQFARGRTNIDEGETERYRIEVGDGDEKRGRIGVRITDDPDVINVATSVEEQKKLPEPLRIRIQQELTVLGFNTQGQNGRFGPATQDAIERFQRSRRREATGWLTTAEIDELLVTGATRETYYVGTRRAFYVDIIIDPESRIDEDSEGNNHAQVGPFYIENCELQ